MGSSLNLRGLIVGLFILLGNVAASPRHAFADDEATEQARKHYQEAQKQFDLGMWDEAIREFTEAYELRPDPNFLYNMAQAYRRGGNARRAIDLYKNYLIKVPKSPQRAEVEERIHSLQRQLEEEEREAKRSTPATPIAAPSLTPESAQGSSEAAAAPAATATAPASTLVPPAETDHTAPGTPDSPQPTTPTQASTAPEPAATTEATPEETAGKTMPTQASGSRPLRIAGLVSGAAGLAGIVGGVVFSVRTKSLSDSTSQAKQFNASDARAGKQAATLQWICYAAGGAAVVAGALFYWRGRVQTGATTAMSLAPMMTPTHVGLLATGAF